MLEIKQRKNSSVLRFLGHECTLHTVDMYHCMSLKRPLCVESFYRSTSVSIELVLLWLWMVEDVFQLG